MGDCLHKRQNGTCEILSKKDGVQEFCVESPCPHDTTLKGDFVRRNNITDRIERHVRRIDDEVYLLSPEDKIFNSALELALEIIDNETAADVVEVVRCKDCKYWGIESGYKESDPQKLYPQPDGTVYAECVHGPVEIGDCMFTDGDFYCAFGNRRTEK